MIKPPKPDPKNPAPYLSHAPWARFNAREHERPEPLPICPQARCRRLKRCVAAHDHLYCQRTHISDAEYMASLPPHKPLNLNSPELVEIYGSMLKADAARRQDAFKALQARWKAGEFDHLYGKWKARGVLKFPPPRDYIKLPYRHEKGR